MQAAGMIADAKKVVVIQAENPDGDSLASSLALEEILSDLGKGVTMYAPVEIPKYLRYITGWDRVENTFDMAADLAVIVDTSADVLLTKVLDIPEVRHFLETHPVLVIDHHTTASTLSFDHTLLTEEAAATGEVIYRLAEANSWPVNQQAAEHMLAAILSDSLGLSTQSVSAATLRVAAGLVERGAAPSVIEGRRRQFMKKSPEILAYKGELIGRIEYFLDGQLTLIHIPWDEIQRYSDQYNPSVLVLEEMLFVEGVTVAVAIKTYPDGKVTGKIRTGLPLADHIAGFFGGGGHSYAAGFRAYEDYDTIIKELIDAVDKVVREHDSQTS
jgi:phosphoesterase RecJ-like protein